MNHRQPISRRLFFALCLILASLFLLSGPAEARTIAGVTVPESVHLGKDSGTYILNGAGIRKKFFIKVYVGALYLQTRSHDVESILKMEGAKRVSMHFVHSKVSVEKIIDGWNKGFSANLTSEELASLQGQLARFNALFRTVRKGDVIHIDFIPGRGTEVWLNNIKMGTVPGVDFYRALLKVWLGSHPADKELKKALLGMEN